MLLLLLLLLLLRLNERKRFIIVQVVKAPLMCRRP